MNHLDLNFEDKVFIKGTNTELDGVMVKVIGVASRHISDSYIVAFVDGRTRQTFENFGQKPMEYSAIVLPEGCLAKSYSKSV